MRAYFLRYISHRIARTFLHTELSSFRCISRFFLQTTPSGGILCPGFPKTKNLCPWRRCQAIKEPVMARIFRVRNLIVQVLPIECADDDDDDSGNGGGGGCDDSGCDDSGCDDSGCDDSGCDDSGCNDASCDADSRCDQPSKCDQGSTCDAYTTCDPGK